MPLGSSSAAPVITPGPSRLNRVWRLHHHRMGHLLVKIQCRLVRRAGGDRGHGAGPPHLDGAMDMAAHHALDIVVSADDLGQPLAALVETHAVEGVDAALE